jgi:putative ABC transport system substrate-binding protein
MDTTPTGLRITVLAGATAWAATARAQESQRLIGVLGSAPYGAFPGAETAFIRGLKATGFFEGKNVSIEWRRAEGQYNRLSLLAGELLSRNVAVIVTFDAPASFAAKAATKTTPRPPRLLASSCRPRCSHALTK